MAKIVTDHELAKIVKHIVENDEIDDADVYKKFLGQLAQVITDFMGGIPGTVDFEHYESLSGRKATAWFVAIQHDENVPEDGGVWKDYDTDKPVHEWASELI